MNKLVQKKRRTTPSFNEVLASAQEHVAKALTQSCSETRLLQSILDSILPHYFGLIENHSVTVGKIKDGVASLFFSNRALASQARFVLQPIIPTLQQHYGLTSLRSFKIIAQSVSTEVKMPERRPINRQRMSDRHCNEWMKTAYNESDEALSDAIARLAYRASITTPL